MFKTKTYATVGLFAITFILYVQGLNFDFTNWDDPQYILKNEWIKNFDKTLFKKAFFETHFGHYHPFTWLSLAFDYMLFNLKPWGYHFHNILLHILNVLLVFLFIQKLTKNNLLSFFVALAFSIHPFANESVMWITERKNLLFSFYYLCSLNCFIYYIEKNKFVYYFLALLMFFASLLSKGAAITMPLTILLILYFYNKLSFKNSLKIIPFLLLSIFFAVIAIKAQSPFFKENNLSLTFFESFMLSSWAGWQYVLKAILPYSMSALHPIILDKIKIYYLAGFVLMLFLFFIVFRSFKKNEKLILFGILFFFINIVMYLKIFNAYASSYYIAERYSYLSNIGLYLALFMFVLNNYWHRKLFRYIIFLWFIFIGVSSYIYGKTWKNSITLWENTLNHYPESHIALLNYGNACRDAKKYDKALKAYEKINYNSSLYTKMLENRAFVYYKLKQYNNALKDYQMLLKLDTSRQDVKQYIINIMLESNENNLAKETILRLLSNNNKVGELWNSLGNYYFKSKQPDSAIWAYSKAIELKPAAMFFYNRANVYSQLNNFDLALSDYNKAISIDSTNADYYLNRGITYFAQKKHIDALNNFNRAIALKPDKVDYYFNRSTLYISIKQFNLAIADLSKVIELQPNNSEALVRRSFLYYQLNELKLACKDIQKVIDLGNNQYKDWKNVFCK